MKRPSIAYLPLALSILLVSDVQARPGGGSSYGGRSSSSSGSRSSSSSGSRSSSSSGSRSSSSGSRSSSGSSGNRSSGSSSTPSIPSFSYAIRSPEDRIAVASLRRPGSLGPYGPGPNRPAELNVESENASAIATTIVLLMAFAVVAVPLGLLAFVLYLIVRKQKQGWSTAAQPNTKAQQSQKSPGTIRKELEWIRKDDPEFSLAVFEDFLYALYAEAHTARGSGSLWKFSPWISPQAKQSLEALGQTPVSTIIVGAMRLCAFNPQLDGGAKVSLTVEFESCYTENPAGSKSRSFFAVERWSLLRARSARSRTPDKVRVFNCPSCGAPLDRLVGNACQYCNRVVDGGVYDWTVQSVQVCERSERAPMLTGTTEEAGTDRPTIRDPSTPQRLSELKQRDPSFSEQGMQARVGLIFQTMQYAWSSLEWHRARPFLSDMLFETQSYWINAYRSQGLRNMTDGARITGLELVRLGSDRWFDSITLRVWATGLDYTVRDSDRAVVGGNPKKERSYSEYWTLIRGTSRKGPTRADAGCPNCGAPLVVNMAALCSHCGVKVNSGAFDWVLSRIEQDESFEG